jgi:hypothetical protein
VQLQLPAAVVSFEDTAMSPEGKLAGLSYLRELEVLCVKKAPTPPPGGLTGGVDEGGGGGEGERGGEGGE